MRKKLLALLLAAALALGLLAGCGGGESVASALLKLLDGRYPNISIEIDPDLEADLRQAIRKAEAENAGDDAAVIRAALEKLVGSTVTFRNLRNGQKGETAFDLVFYAGSDPDKAAQAAYSQWDPILSNVPADGKYDTSLAMVETNSGVWMLVKATVEKAGTVDKPDKDDDEPEQPEPEDEKVEGNGFTYNVTKKTITVEPDDGKTNGLQELFFNSTDPDVQAARNSGFEKVTIELAANTTYTVSKTFTTPFRGILKGEDKETTIIKLTGNGLFAQIGVYGSGPDENNGAVKDITFDVQTTITNTYPDNENTSNYAGAAAGRNYGEITNCDVTIGSGKTIHASENTSKADAGGLVGYNSGEITGCHVTIYGTVSAQKRNSNGARAGGLAGSNDGTITDCKVTIENGGSIQTTGTSASAKAGGIAGDNIKGKITGDSQVTIEIGGSITATVTGTSDSVYAGGLVGRDFLGNVTGTYSFSSDALETITAQAGLSGDTYNDIASVPYKDEEGVLHYTKTDDNASAGTKWGGDMYGEPSAHDPNNE